MAPKTRCNNGCKKAQIPQNELLKCVFGDGFKKSGFRPKSYRNFSVKITEIHQPIVILSLFDTPTGYRFCFFLFNTCRYFISRILLLHIISIINY